MSVPMFCPIPWQVPNSSDTAAQDYRAKTGSAASYWQYTGKGYENTGSYPELVVK